MSDEALLTRVGTLSELFGYDSPTTCESRSDTQELVHQVRLKHCLGLLYGSNLDEVKYAVLSNTTYIDLAEFKLGLPFKPSAQYRVLNVASIVPEWSSHNHTRNMTVCEALKL